MRTAANCAATANCAVARRNADGYSGIGAAQIACGKQRALSRPIKLRDTGGDATSRISEEPSRRPNATAQFFNHYTFRREIGVRRVKPARRTLAKI